MSLMKSYFLKLDKFQAEKFLISGYLMAKKKKQAAVSYKLVSYMRVLTIPALIESLWG